MEKAYLCTVLQETAFIAGWSSPVARQAHNLKVVGSNPSPATNSENGSVSFRFFVSAVFCKIKEATGGFFILTVRWNYKSG